MLNASTKDISQIYHMVGKTGEETEELTYSCDTIGLDKGKWIPLLLKEWMWITKPNGFIVIDYKINKGCDFDSLEKNLWWVWKGFYEIEYHGPVEQEELNEVTDRKLQTFIKKKEDYYQNNLDKETHLPHSIPTTKIPSIDGYLRLIVKKTKTHKVSGDSIDKWTFGIITNGKRIDWLKEMIASIRSQHIPHYEIIICGSYLHNPQDTDITYIPFNQRDDMGWITKKKNLIVSHASFNNLCILHDRITLHPSWFSNIKTWGNAFEMLGCRQVYNNERAGDWLTYGGGINSVYKIAQLEYTDWDQYVYLSGQLTILKKHVWEVTPWDETLYFEGKEDVHLSFAARDEGFLTRFNPDAICSTFSWRHGALPAKYNREEGLLPKGMWGRRIIRSSGRFMYKIPLLQNIIGYGYNKFSKNKVYQFLIRH